jgi:hypothetical protein
MALAGCAERIMKYAIFALCLDVYVRFKECISQLYSLSLLFIVVFKICMHIGPLQSHHLPVWCIVSHTPCIRYEES